MDGLRSLKAIDAFIEPQSSTDAIMTLQDLVSPISAFIRDRCDVGAKHEVPVDELYRAWRSWCEDEGRDRPGSAATFGKNLRAKIAGVKKIRAGGDDAREYRYVGIRLKQQWPGPRTYPDEDDGVAAGVLGENGQNSRSDADVPARPSSSPLLSPLEPQQSDTCQKQTAPMSAQHPLTTQVDGDDQFEALVAYVGSVLNAEVVRVIDWPISS
jgi:phage/plasmid-associated DNA primase